MSDGNTRTPDRDGVGRRELLTGGGAATVALLAGCSTGDEAQHGEAVPPQTIEAGKFTNFPDVAREVGKQWSELGVEFSVETSTWGTYVPRVYVDNEFEDAAHTPWGSSPDRVDPNFHLSTYTSDSSLNISGYENPAYDELFRKQSAAYDRKERNEHIAEMERILRKDLPEIVLVWPKATLPINSAKWDIEPTKFIGARTTGTMTVLTARPKGETKRLVVGAQQELSAPNPLAPGSNDVQYLFKLAYDTPRRVGLDGKPKNWAVESFETTEKTTIDMTLREGMTWHDGEDVTAEDLQFSFQFLTEYDFPKYQPYLSDVESAEVRDDRTVRVTLASPNVAFLSSAMTFMNILPKHVWETVPEKVDQPVNYDMPVEEMVGSGPLEITGLDTSELRMKRFDDHFRPPEFEEFVFVNRASMEAIRAAFVEQNIHMTTSSPPPSVTNALAEKPYLTTSTAPSVLQMKFSFDLSKKPYSDLAFRKALLQATDARKVGQLFYDGKVDMADGTLLHPQLPWGTDGLAPVGPADVEGAKKTLRDAGYTFDGDRLRYPA